MSNHIDSNPDIIKSMKICSTCKQTKIDDEFDFKNKDANIRHARCRPCQKEYGRSHYQKNKEIYRTRNKRLRLQYREEVKSLKEKPCADCGQIFPYYVMDFDHIEGNKVASVSRLMNARKIEQTRKEILKCDVVCANCHRERTHRRLLKRMGL